MQEIKLKGYTAAPGYLHLGTQDSYGIETLHVEGWDGMTVTVTFHTPGGQAIEMLVPADGIVQVPPEATAAGTRRPDGKIVFAGVKDGAKIFSCDVRYDLTRHAAAGGSQSAATPSLSDQVLSEVKAVREEVADCTKQITTAAAQVSTDAYRAEKSAINASAWMYRAKASEENAAESAKQANEAAETVNGVVDTIPTGGTLLGTTLNFTRKKQQGLNTVTTTLFTVGVGGLMDKTLTKSNRAAEAAATAAAITEAKRGAVSESITGNPITATMGADRIESVAVQGLTTQAGTGEASPENVREISGVGVYDACVVLDGSTPIETSAYANIWFIMNVYTGIECDPAVAPFGSYMQGIIGDIPSNQAAYELLNPGQICFRTGTTNDRLYICIEASNADEVKSLLSANPLTVWYKKATHTEGDPYYTGVSIEDADGYHGYALPLAQPLYTGDTVETNVVGEYDKKVVLDGSEAWDVLNSGVDGVYRFIYRVGDVQYVGNASTMQGVASNDYESVIPNDTYYAKKRGVSTSTSHGLIFFDPDIQTSDDWKAYLVAQAAAGTPVAVWYKSTANGAPLRICKETHAMKKLVLDGTEAWETEALSNGLTRFVAWEIADKCNITNVVVCSHYKGVSNPTSDGTIRVTASGGVYALDTDYTTVDAWKAYLAAQYAAGTPVTIVYKLATPEVYAHEPVEIGNEAGSVVITADNTCEARLWANASKGDIAALLKRIEALENA